MSTKSGEAQFLISVQYANAEIDVWTHKFQEGVRGLSVVSGGETLYASTASIDNSDVFRSTDGGNTWDRVASRRPPIHVLAADPTTPRVVFAGTSPYNNIASRLFKSIDGGDTWAGVGLYGVNVIVLTFDPFTPSTIYAGTDRGVFRSTDSGETWNSVYEGWPALEVSAISVDPVAPHIVYVGGLYNVGGFHGVVLKTADGGDTWDSANTGLPVDPPVSVVAALVIDPLVTSTLYAATGGPFSAGIFKSIDAGGTWSASSTGLPSHRVTKLVIDPRTPSTLYATTRWDGASNGVSKSTDGGANWSSFNTGLPKSAVSNQYPFVRALVIDASNPSLLYAGTDRGVFVVRQRTACIGDCGGEGLVAINDIIMLVNVSLGNVDPATCVDGSLPISRNVDVSTIIQAVNNALSGCPPDP